MKGPSDEQPWSSSHSTSKKELIKLAGQQRGTDCKCQMEVIIRENNTCWDNESLHKLLTEFQSFCLSVYIHSQTEPDITTGYFMDHVRIAFSKPICSYSTNIFLNWPCMLYYILSLWIGVNRKIFPGTRGGQNRNTLQCNILIADITVHSERPWIKGCGCVLFSVISRSTFLPFSPVNMKLLTIYKSVFWELANHFVDITILVWVDFSPTPEGQNRVATEQRSIITCSHFYIPHPICILAVLIGVQCLLIYCITYVCAFSQGQLI